jgi:DNA-binding response OmpR family regulator
VGEDGDIPDTQRILVFDRDRERARFTLANLDISGLEAGWAGSPEQALERLHARRFALAIVDMLEPDGESLVRSITANGSGVPVLALGPDERIAADLTQPGSVERLRTPLGRQRLLDATFALLRRQPIERWPRAPEDITVGPLTLSPERIRAEVRARSGSLLSPHLSLHEFHLLWLLAGRQGTAVEIGELCERVCGGPVREERQNIVNLIYRLRTKIERPSGYLLFHSDRAIGYRCEPE